MVKPMGLLIASFNYSRVAEDEFNDWYDCEHIPQRLAIPGFISAVRWLGADDPKISVVAFDLESADVLESPPYMAVVERTCPRGRDASSACARTSGDLAPSRSCLDGRWDRKMRKGC